MSAKFTVRSETWSDVRYLKEMMQGKGQFKTIEEREAEIDRVKEQISDKVITQLLNYDTRELLK